MKPLFGIAAGLALCLGFLLAPAASAAPCACAEICCFGPHHPGVNCETACCTLSGWTTCEGYGHPACEALTTSASHTRQSSEPSWLQAEGSMFSQPLRTAPASDAVIAPDDSPQEEARLPEVPALPS